MFGLLTRVYGMQSGFLPRKPFIEKFTGASVLEELVTGAIVFLLSQPQLHRSKIPPYSALQGRHSSRRFGEGIENKPKRPSAYVKTDVLPDKDPAFQRINFCSIIRNSPWQG